MLFNYPSQPGYYFYPHDPDKKYIKLTLQERAAIFSDCGIYTAPLFVYGNEFEKTDLICAMDNSRIPTHRDPMVNYENTMIIPITKETVKGG